MSDDWVLVPREPTEAMRFEGIEASTKAGVVDTELGVVASIYRAMLAAAPTSPPEAADLRARDAAPIVGEREAFEAWFGHPNLKRDANGYYTLASAYAAWEAWSARAALPSGGGAREAAHWARARDIVQAYAAHNPKWRALDTSEQDPMGAHAWLEADARNAHIPSAPAGLTDSERMVLGERLMSALEVDRYPGITDQNTRWRLFGLLAESLVTRLTGGQKS